MKKFRFIIFAFLLVGWALPSTAQQVPELINSAEFRPDAKAAVDSIYNFNFSGADKVLAPWKKRYPSHPLWTLFKGMEYWWKVLSDLEDTSHDEKFYNMMKRANYQAGKLLHREPENADGLIIRAISNGYLARQYANREEWLTSINYGRKAMSAHEYLEELQPNLDDLKLAEGLKLYYLAYLPEKYPVIKTVSWALPDGNKQKGLKYLHKAADEAVFASAEATYFLGNINYNYEHNYKIAVRNFEKLQSQYPNNNYYARILVKSYFKQHQYQKALAFIDASLQRWKRRRLPYLHIMQEELLTWKGRILEKQDQKEQALECYKKAFETGGDLPNTSHRSFYVVSGYMAGKLLYHQQQYDKAKWYLKKVVDADAESTYQKHARELLSKIS